MVVGLKNLQRTVLTSNDIVINDITTYPKELLKDIFCGGTGATLKKFFGSETSYSVIGVHFTRLFDKEICDIRKHGLRSDDFEDYSRKIQQLPKEFDDYKSKLISYVNNPCNRQSDGKIYFDIGKIEINGDNAVFLENWGGETLYNYYCPFNQNNELRRLGDMLRHNSTPCIVIIRINAQKFFSEYINNDILVDCIRNEKLLFYRDEFCINKDDVQVVDVMPLVQDKHTPHSHNPNFSE